MRSLITIALLFLLSFSIAGFAACSKQEKNNAGVDRYNKGVAFMEQGEYTNAINEFNAALRADPSFFEARKNLAGAYVYENNWQAAKENYQLAIELQPDDASVYANLAYVYEQMGEREIAWDNIDKALAADPTYPLVHYRAGELFLDAGDTEQAKAAFGDVLRFEAPGSRLATDAQTQIDAIDFPDGLPGSEDSLESDLTNSYDDELMPNEELTADEDTEEIDEEETPEIDDTPVEEDKPEEVSKPDESEEDEAVDETTETDEADEVVEPEPPAPELTGDALYQDRLGRGRQMRAIGSTGAAIRLLLEAYEVHPGYAGVNYELALAYLGDGQTDLGVTYLKDYIALETDPDLKASAEARLKAIEEN